MKRPKLQIKNDSTTAVEAARGRRAVRKQRQAELQSHADTAIEHIEARGFERAKQQGRSKYAKKKSAQRRAA